MSLSTKPTQGERREGERERKRVDGGKKEREPRRHVPSHCNRSQVCSWTFQLPKLIHYIKLKQQQCKNTRHNELLSTTICPHCSLFTCPGICTWLPSLTLPNATSKLLTEFHAHTFPDKVLYSPQR